MNEKKRKVLNIIFPIASWVLFIASVLVGFDFLFGVKDGQALAISLAVAIILFICSLAASIVGIIFTRRVSRGLCIASTATNAGSIVIAPYIYVAALLLSTEFNHHNPIYGTPVTFIKDANPSECFLIDYNGVYYNDNIPDTDSKLLTAFREATYVECEEKHDYIEEQSITFTFPYEDAGEIVVYECGYTVTIISVFFWGNEYFTYYSMMDEVSVQNLFTVAKGMVVESLNK